MSQSQFQQQIDEVRAGIQEFAPKCERLKNLDLFVLDNSLRETTVAQLRSHTIENKWAIYNEVKRVGFKHIIVESFSHMTRIGDTFIRQLKEKGEDMSLMYAFTEFIEKVHNDDIKKYKKEIPIGLLKCKELGIKNCVMEVDLVYHTIDYTKFTAQKMCELVSERFRWIRKKLSKHSHIFVNLRDIADAMMNKPRRVFKLVNYLSSLPAKERPFGIIFEEPSGKYLPEVLGVWTAAIRKEMDRCGFKDGHLLAHIHQKWGFQDVTQLEILVKGANGIWAGVCEEGAAMGHACSAVTMMNLIRMGNKKILENFNCRELRKAAQNVTKITTGLPPHPKQVVYGGRALDMVFGMGGMGGMGGESCQDKGQIYKSLADFFGEEQVMRITTLASSAMIVKRLQNLFGEDPLFTEETANRMKEVMLEDLHANRKEEYMSAVGLAMLFDRSGGKLTEKMCVAIAKAEPESQRIQELITEVRDMWDMWDLRDGVKDDVLEFDAFYNGFMAPYFGCYRCDETKKALQAIDMDADGKVDWNEFALYLKWAGHEYPDVKDAEELISIAFRKGLVPAMQDEVIKQLASPTDELLEGGDDNMYPVFTDDDDLDFMC